MSCKLYFVQTNILHRVMSISDILELYLITALYAKMKLFLRSYNNITLNCRCFREPL